MKCGMWCALGTAVLLLVSANERPRGELAVHKPRWTGSILLLLSHAEVDRIDERQLALRCTRAPELNGAGRVRLPAPHEAGRDHPDSAPLCCPVLRHRHGGYRAAAHGHAAQRYGFDVQKQCRRGRLYWCVRLCPFCARGTRSALPSLPRAACAHMRSLSSARFLTRLCAAVNNVAGAAADAVKSTNPRDKAYNNCM